MNKSVISIFIIFFALLLGRPAWAFPDENSSSILAGKILRESGGLEEFWYVNPSDFHRYKISGSEPVFEIIKNISLLEKAPSRFFRDENDSNCVYYINQKNNSSYCLDNSQNAKFFFYSEATTTSDCILRDIPIGKISFNELGQITKREWQYNGWWGRVNYKYVPAMSGPSDKAKKFGAYSTINRLKIIGVEESKGKTWYRVDGGLHPGAYVEARFIDPIPQPTPEHGEIILPQLIDYDEYWVDVNLSRFVLTLFKGSEPFFATYVSTGVEKSPTVTGIFNVRYRIKKVRMHGSPPKATHFYDLKDVPWTMYYHDSYALHGAYWHDEFGGQRSAGCTNLTIGDSKYLFDLLSPFGDAEKVKFSKDNPGSLVRNHY